MVLLRDPWWKQALLLFLVVFSLIYSLPNLYGEDLAVQVSASNGGDVHAMADRMRGWLNEARVTPQSTELSADQVLFRFKQPESQLKAKDILVQQLGSSYTVALNLAPATPTWLRALGAKPMKLGLDLRGGVHFLLEVDVDSVVASQQTGLIRRLGESLRGAHMAYREIRRMPGQEVRIWVGFSEASLAENARNQLQKDFSDYQLSVAQESGQIGVIIRLGDQAIQTMRQHVLEQTLTILRNRVNELGISEAVVQQQGQSRIAVDLPGVQDTARAKDILGGTATLEFRLVESKRAPDGSAPLGSRVYHFEDGTPVLLKNTVVLTGEAITSANAGYADEGMPAVFLSIGGPQVSYFNRVTSENVGQRMAIVFVETKIRETRDASGQVKKEFQKMERVLSAPEIRSSLGSHFQITGVGSQKASSNLALMLRSGALLAPIDIVEERTIGPSMGVDNIRKGLLSMEVGLAAVALFMMAYYSLFGVIANIAMGLNVLFLTALLSIFGATLTLPGIAAMVLTMGMAVDANVLIYERIREELRLGTGPQASIMAGFERAFATILDSNLTSLIVGMVLFSMGTSAVKGFAVTLCLGLLTSMLTAVTFSQCLVKWIYGGHRTIRRLHIGM